MDNTSEPGQGTGNAGDAPGAGMERAEESTLRRTAVERGARRLDEIIDQAVAQISDEEERNVVREGVQSIVRDTLNELVEQETRQLGVAAAPEAGAIGGVAQAGMEAAARVQSLGFVEFTAGLINGTFDAIIGATVKQMDAYAKLVADLAKSLAQFQAENVTEAQITSHLAQRYPDGQGGTSVRATYTFTETPANPETGAEGKSANAKFQEVVSAVIQETSKLPSPYKLSREDEAGSTSLGIPANDTSMVQFTENHIPLIRASIGRSLATNMIEHLRGMAREGMARIVIQNGEISTKLTFNVTSSEQQSRQASQYHRDSFGVSVSGSAGWGWGRVSAGVDYSNLNVNTVNESSFDTLTMSTEMIGQVKLQFRTESFPPYVTAGGDGVPATT